MHGANLCGGLVSIVMLMQLLAMPGFGHAQGPSLFQCQPSTEEDGLVFTPNIPDFYFNHENAGEFRTNPGANLTSLRRDLMFIFTIPPESLERDCSGSVVAIQFCYEYRGNKSIGSTVRAFQFLTLTRDEFKFTVNISFTVQTTLTTCTNDLPGAIQRVCCSKITSNDFGKLVIPSSEFIFGMAHNRDYELQILAFDMTATEYQLDQFQQSVDGIPLLPGSNIPLTPRNLVNEESFSVLRFFIGDDGTDSTSSTAGEAISTTYDDGTTKSATINSSAPDGSSIAVIGGVVGGVVGGIVAVVLTLLLTLLIILLVRRRQRKTTSKDISYNNAMYEVTETRKDANQTSAARQEANGATTDGPVYSVVDVSHKKQKSSKSAATELLPSQSEGTYSVVTSVNDEGEGYSALDRRDNGGEQEAYSTLDHTVSTANGGTVQGEAYSILNHTSRNQKAGNTEPNAADDYDQIETGEEEYGQLEHT